MHTLFEYTPGRKNHIPEITVDAGYNNSGMTSFFINFQDYTIFILLNLR
jgi:hypothetical protein